MGAVFGDGNKLAGLILDVGYACTTDEAAFKSLLQQLPELNEAVMAEVLAVMARTYTGLTDRHGLHSTASTWNVNLVVDIFKATKPGLDWKQVAELLDVDAFAIPDQQAFQLLTSAFQRGCGQQLSLHAVVGKQWVNGIGQLSLIRQAVMAPPEVFSFEGSDRKIPPVEGLAGGKSPIGSPNHAWRSVDLLHVLCVLAEAGHVVAARQILETPARECPEVLLLAMAAVPPTDWSVLQQEVYSALLPLYLPGAILGQPRNPNSSVVLKRLWNSNQRVFMEALIAYFDQDHSHLPHILDVCLELSALNQVLDTAPYRLALELATLAASKQPEQVMLERWLNDSISRDHMVFTQAVLRFLEGRLMHGLDQQTLQQQLAAGKGPLTEHVVRAYFTVLNAVVAAGALPAELVGEVKKMQQMVARASPELGRSIAPAEGFASDVEFEANTYFQKIYSEQKPIDEVVQMLKQFKSSPNMREQEVFACMIHNLFDEYRFFSRYPDRELQITATLFGALIQHQLVSSITLGIALRYILDALKKPPGSKLSTFGVGALRQFLNNVQQWPQFCTALLQIPQLKEADAELYAHIEQTMAEPADAVPGLDSTGGGFAPTGLHPMVASAPAQATGEEARMPFANGMGDASRAQQGSDGASSSQADAGQGAGQASSSLAAAASVGGKAVSQVSQGEGDATAEIDKEGSVSLAAQVAASSLAAPVAKETPSFTSMVNTESLETAAEKFKDYEEPPEKIQDRLHFIMNNLSTANIDSKVQEVKDLIGEKYLAWFANYLVVKRAAQEVNYHNLYMMLVDKMNNKELHKLLLKTSHYYVGIQLYSERTVKESNERALLKNLGMWMGLLTFAKNRPILTKDLDIKRVILEAYQRGRLVVVLPFVQKLLECCKDSKVFKANNPMIAGILSLLAELHSIKGLKINNAFSIELVFKSFGCGPLDVVPTDVLRNLQRENLNNMDWGMEQLPEVATSSAPSVPAEAKAAMAGATSAPATPPAPLTAQSLSQQQARAAEQAAAGKAGAAGAAGDAAAAGASMAPSMPSPPTPQMGSLDQGIIAQLHNYVVINPQLNPIAERLQLKRHVPSAVDRAIFEILSPVVERSVTIACYTTVELIMKDFAFDPDEHRMRKAAHLMVSSLAGSLALVTCKDPLRVSLTNSMRSLLQGNLEQPVLEQVVNMVVQDNLDLGCTVIERAATDKAIRDVDKLLQSAYDERAKARSQGKTYTDTTPFHGRFPASLPESLKPRPGVVLPAQLRVYEDFVRIPRTASPQTMPTPGVPPQQGPRPGFPGAPGMFPGAEGAAADKPGPEAMAVPTVNAAWVEKYILWQQSVSQTLSFKELEQQRAGNVDQTDLQLLLQEMQDMVTSSNAMEDFAVFFAKRILKHMYEAVHQAPNPTNAKMTATFHVACLDVLTNNLGIKRLPLDLTNMWIMMEDERKYHQYLGELLIRARIFSLPELDTYLAKTLATARTQAATDLVMHIMKVTIIQQQVIAYADVFQTLEVLSKLAQRTPGNDAVLALLDQARKVVPTPAITVSRPASEVPTAMRDPKTDPAGLREQCIQLFEEWLRLLSTAADDKAVGQYMVSLRTAGLLKMDETTDRFLRMLCDLATSHCLSSADAAAPSGARGSAPDVTTLSFIAVDALVRLVVTVIVGGLGETFLTRFLNVLAAVVKRDADTQLVGFNARPYLRLMVGLMAELGAVEPVDTTGLRYLKAIGLALYNLQPISVPGFAFAWLELISHRALMPKLLQAPQAQGWALFEVLLVALLKFLEPYLRAADLCDSVRQLYKGTLRVLLVLLHDFPEFLCEHHFKLCDVIPASCIQMRNLILSAFPRNMRLPDPFTPNLKVDLLPEISQPPRILPEPDKLLPEQLKLQVDTYLRTRLPATFPQELLKRLYLPVPEHKAAGTAYNSGLINALVLYVGSQAKSVASPMNTPAMELYLRLTSELDMEGRYLLLNAVANQLRYPNSHTHYFSCVLLTLFSESKQDLVKEQITRVLLERLIVNRPHPWGLLITFIELIKNPRYNFWSHDFTRCAPDIERLFKSVANSCMGPLKAEDEQQTQVLPKETAVRG